jgi:hypothetical protein
VGYITEIDYPGCRWLHTPGSTTNVTYKWQSGDPFVNPDQPWRDALYFAFEEDWEGPNSSRLRFQENLGGVVTAETYFDVNVGAVAGRAFPNCNASTQSTLGYTVEVNRGARPNDQNYRTGIANHEVGHSHSFGHLSYRKGNALMGNNPGGAIIRPNSIDFDLDRRIYP